MKFITLLNEGKKENLISKYGNELIFDNNDFISTIVDSDPSSTKKYSEWTINQVIEFMKVNDGASLPDVITQITDSIKTFNDVAQSITDEDITFAKKLHSGIDDTYIKGGPRDIYRYRSYWELQTLLSAIDKRKKDKEQEVEAKKDVDKIYEDSRFLIVQPYSHKASCYYGAGTKWCTSSKDNENYFDRYGTDGRLIYIIDKQSKDTTFGKMAIHINRNDNVWIYDQKNEQRSEQFLLDRFEPIAETIKKMIKGDDDYTILKKIAEGKLTPSTQKLTAPYFKKMDKEDVYLSFDDVKEYLSLFSQTLEDYEIESYAYAVDSPYGYESYYYDPYNFMDDLKEGYPLYDFNAGHLKKLKEVLEIAGSDLVKSFKTTPNVSKEKLIRFKELGHDLKDYYELYDLSIFDKDGSLEKMGEFIGSFDAKFLDTFDDTYGYAKNQAMEVGVQKALKEELCEIYKPIGIELESACFYKYYISISKLISMYEENLEYNKNLSLNEMLIDYVQNNLTINVEEPHNLAYENIDQETFAYYFNDNMDSAFDNLLERLQDSDSYIDLKVYREIYNFIENKYGWNKTVSVEPLSKNKSKDTVIEFFKINPETNKIDFQLKKLGNYGIKKGSAKLSTIQKLMTNYQLFDPFDD